MSIFNQFYMRKLIQKLGDKPNPPGRDLLGVITLFSMGLFIFSIYLGVGEIITFVIFVSFILHYLIYTHHSLAVLFSILCLGIISPIFTLSENIGIILYLVLLVVFLVAIIDSTIATRLFAPIIFVGGVLLYSIFNTPLTGPDALMFFNQINTHEGLLDYATFATEEIIDKVGIPGVRQLLPLFYFPLYELADLTSAKAIIIVNASLWILTAAMFRDMCQEYLEHLNISSNLIFIALLISPSAMFWASTFLKEIVSVFLATLSAYAILKGRYITFVLVLLLATNIRMYSIAIVGIYVSLILWSPLLLSVGLIGSILFLFIYTGTAVALLNSILIWGYFFLSPNPVNSENWTSIVLLPRTLQGILFFMILLISARYFLDDWQNKKGYVLLGIAMLIYALVLASVGYRNAVITGESVYSFGTIGDNILRKQLPILPVIAVWISYTANHILGIDIATHQQN